MIPTVITRNVGKVTLLASKSSPEVLLAAGIAGMVGSTVLACRATLKMDDILEDAQGKLEMARTLEHRDYSSVDRSRDVTLIRVQTGMKVARAYAPAVALGVVSIYALTSSNRILTQRNVALTAAYTALERGFNQYRGRVVDRYGEETDRELRYGTTNVVIDDPDKAGKTKTVKRVGPEAESIYAKFFDPTCPAWSPDPEVNMLFLNCQQQFLNDRLHVYGHVFLNEAYDALGIPRTRAGQVVGWVLSGDGETDNYIDFGIFDGKKQVTRDFVNGREGSILLDFNVDGLIYDKLED